MKHIAAGLVLSGVLSACMETHAQTMRPVLDYKSAEIIRDACVAYAEETGNKIAVAVFDAGGELVAYTRTDLPPDAGAAAQWKGRSAAFYLTPSSETGKWGIPTAPAIATLGGGMPIFARDGTGLGGVGVAGAAVEFDVECAIRGIEAAGLSANGLGE
ncbi:MAG: hypothetical protein Kow00133_00170 [Amphiplicatus sp.]